MVKNCIEPVATCIAAVGVILGALLGEESMQVLRWFNMFAADGVIELIKKGNEHLATRYRWIGKGGTQ